MMGGVRPRFKIAAVESTAHREWIRGLGCCVPDCRRTPIHTHHARTKGAGGDARDLTPLCWEHHAEFHQIGRLTWEDKYDLDLTVIAARLASMSERAGRLP